MARPAKKLSLMLPVEIPQNVAPIPIKTDTPTTGWVTVTPELAVKWLDECNTNNRPVRQDHVARLASDMLAGKWRMNGEPIKFDTEGRLFEGQHRCWACVEAETPFDTLVITGCDPGDYLTSGVGRPKNFGDFLGPVYGEKNTALLAATIRLVYYWHNDLLARMKDGKLAPTFTQLQETLQSHPAIRESVNRVSNNKNMRFMTPSYSTLIHYAGTLEGKNATVESFLERLGNGLGLTETDPVYNLRRFILSQRGPRPGTRRAAPLYLLALAIKAWNLSKNGKTTKDIRFRSDETFPQL